ncbi:MAG: hypothetical protein BWY17_04036 [Deltaproteobacteria bacterium ADurb.Bin207]|nr:MAG: hypothetical protein BWY17_04036 [Deltaproteobacteria bacterium ADurb.Bin207]
MFGRHVLQASFELPGARGLESYRRFGDAEVENASDSIESDHDILGRHIAVDDMQGLAILSQDFMGGMQPLKNVGDDGGYDAMGGIQLCFVRGLDEAAHGIAREVFHDDDQVFAFGCEVEDRNDIGVSNACREVGLIEEHGHEVRITRAMGMHSLDGHRFGKLVFVDSTSVIHGRHTAGCNLSLQHIASNDEGQFDSGEHGGSSYLVPRGIVDMIAP